MKKTVVLLLAVVSLPISFYIQYSVLQAIHADRLLMFLFWVNVPLGILITAISKAIEKVER